MSIDGKSGSLDEVNGFLQASIVGNKPVALAQFGERQVKSVRGLYLALDDEDLDRREPLILIKRQGRGWHPDFYLESLQAVESVL